MGMGTLRAHERMRRMITSMRMMMMLMMLTMRRRRGMMMTVMMLMLAMNEMMMMMMMQGWCSHYRGCMRVGWTGMHHLNSSRHWCHASFW
jgi:hypothetical protein